MATKSVILKMHKKGSGNSYSVEFTAMNYDDPNYPLISGLVVSMGNLKATTDITGKCTISGFTTGTYLYSATHPDYDTLSGSVTLGG